MSGILGGIVGNLAGGNIGRAVVSLALDTTGYNSQLEKAKVQTAASTNTMGAGFDKFKGLAVAGAAVATAAVVDFAKESVQAAIEAEASQLKLANAVQNSSLAATDAVPAFQAQAQALRDLTGVDDDLINSAQSILVNMGLQEDQITQLTPLVVDLSQKYGVSLDAAMKAVGKAALGSTGGLARMVGPIETGATAAATYSNVLEKLGAVQGFAAQQANAEPWRLLSAQFGELQEKVGAELLPALKDMVPAIQDILDALEPLVTFMAGQAGQQLSDFATVIAEIADEADNLHAKVPAASGAVGMLIDAVSSGLNPVGAYISKAIEMTGATEETTAATFKAYAGTTTYTDKMFDLSDATDKATAAANKHVQAMQEERLQLLQGAGSILGLVGSLEDAAGAQRQYQQAQDRGKTHGAAYNQIVLDAISSQQAFAVELRQFAAEHPGKQFSDITGVLKSLSRQQGVTASDFTNVLGKSLDNIGDKIDNLNRKMLTVHIDPVAERNLQRLEDRMSKIGP
jgi:hypothetical protein